MNQALILSKLRIEIRRKQAGYPTERTMIRVAKQFMERMSLSHASQIREWHKDLFLAQLKTDTNISDEELLQTKSALLFLFERVLKPSGTFVHSEEEAEKGAGVFRITG